MLSVAMYPGAEWTSYMIGNFGSILVSLIGVTVFLMSGVFYFYPNQ